MSEKKFDVTALGELLIDFTENGHSDQGNILFEANPGGAPCNVLAMLTKLGKKPISDPALNIHGRRLAPTPRPCGCMRRSTRLWLSCTRSRTATGIFHFIETQEPI